MEYCYILLFKNDENNEFSYFKIKIGEVNMLNIQDVSHLSKKEQKAYNRFVESVENGNLPVLPCIEMDLKEMKEETLNQSKIGGMPF